MYIDYDQVKVSLNVIKWGALQLSVIYLQTQHNQKMHPQGVSSSTPHRKKVRSNMNQRWSNG